MLDVIWKGDLGLSRKLKSLQGHCGRLEGTVGAGVYCGTLSEVGDTVEG